MRLVSLFFAGLVFCLLGACDGRNKNEWRQKLTATVEINGSEYVGSSVSKMRAKGAGRLAYESRGVAVKEDFEGEAVVIDLGEHGYLFALWEYQDPGIWARSLLGAKNYRGDYTETEKQRRAYYNEIAPSGAGIFLRPGKIPDYNTNYPLLVAFRNINDPKTIQVFMKEFHYEKRGQTDLVFDESAFRRLYGGGGAKVTSIKFEITDDAVTVGALSAVLKDDYFKKWHSEVGKFKHPADCIDKTNNIPFCSQHKAMWVRKFPGSSK